MKNHMKYFFILLLAMSSVQKVDAMSILDIGRTCVFSEVKVRLTRNGEPLKNAKVIRRWDWNKSHSDESFTNDNGIVTFPAVFESSVSRLLPIELVIGQQLSVYVDSEEKIFWSNSKREPEINAEYGGKPFIAQCEITNEEQLIQEYGSLMVTMCKLTKEI